MPAALPPAGSAAYPAVIWGDVLVLEPPVRGKSVKQRGTASQINIVRSMQCKHESMCAQHPLGRKLVYKELVPPDLQGFCLLRVRDQLRCILWLAAADLDPAHEHSLSSCKQLGRCPK